MLKKIYLGIKAIKNIGTLIFDYIGLLKRDVTYQLRNDTTLIARGGSTDAAEIIIINSDLEYPKKYFPSVINPVIIDAGANIGAFSIYIAKKLYINNPTIYAIEPSIYNTEYLKKNIRINKFKNNIRVFNIGLYDKNRKDYIDLETAYDSYRVINKSDSNRPEAVNLVTIENFCLRNKIHSVDLLKMDIEGSEYCVFYSSIDYIKKHIRKILIEVHDLDKENNIQNFRTFIKKSNFKIVDTIMGRTLVLENKNRI